jgi:dipeptidyl aminopeptidase/acylaminoacyl peptidase
MPRHLTVLVALSLLLANLAGATGWQQPPADIMEVLHAPQLPWVWTNPTGEYLLLADPVLYPPLAELAAPMHKLAGLRVDPRLNAIHGRHGGLAPRLVRVQDGKTTTIAIPDGAEVHGVEWTVDGERFALTVAHSDHLGLWVGGLDGKVKKIDDVAVNPLLGSAVSWLPDQKRLLVRRISDRGPVPAAPAIPAGPVIIEGAGATARSTYEARNLLETAHDDALFAYYTFSELVIVDPRRGRVQVIGESAPYIGSEFSPDGRYLLVQRLVEPWSHEVAYWRFAREVEVWNEQGEVIAHVASQPVADAVPIQGVPEGLRSVSWRATAPHTL